MFVQIIQGMVSDKDEMRAAVDRWVEEVSPGAIGWLGSTGGVTDAGQLIAVVRFESEDAARRNSDRPEQDQWWTQMSKLFTTEPTFTESDQVDVEMAGNPDDAGFVQVIQGRSSDLARARQLMSQDLDARAAFRPDILGSMAVAQDGGAYTVAIYFTSEAAAREGEQKDAPPELAARMEEMGKLEAGEPTFLDLRDPWMHSPA
jgi:hypothetical protein